MQLCKHRNTDSKPYDSLQEMFDFYANNNDDDTSAYCVPLHCVHVP